MGSSRPNLLLLMAEQFSALSDPNYVDFPTRTPTLDRLAAEGVRFENAYTNAPVCGPARMSFLTGRYVCNHEAYDNGSALPSHMPTFGHLLTANGYRTILCGRMHYHGLDPLKGFERHVIQEIHSPLLHNPGDFPGAFEPIRPLAPAPADAAYEPAFSDSPVYRHDDCVTQAAREFLLGYPASEDRRPFCMTVGYLTAHPGGKPIPELRELYDFYLAQDLPTPRFTREQYDRLSEHLKRHHQFHNHTEEIFREAMHHHEMAWYLARVTYLDRQLGRVLDALDEAGLAGDTVVVFIADHGEGMGRHGLWGKMYFSEEPERVPLYVRGPGARAGAVVSERACTVDVLPTLAALAGCETPFPVDGESLAPLLDGSRPERDRTIFAEYHGYLSPSDAYMVIKGDYKYCRYLLEPCELYNLAEDPAEERDLGDAPELAEVRADLEQEIRRRVDIEAVAERIREYNVQRQATADAMAASALMQKWNQDYIAWRRREENDPCWDGGAYAARWEHHLYAATGARFGEDGT